MVRAGHTACQPCSVRAVTEKFLEVGEQYGRLTVLEKSGKSGCSRFECDCGKIVIRNNWNVTSGKTNSCGCLRADNMKKVGAYPAKENHWNWQGGIADERGVVMQSKEYKDWRKNVFERDEYTCKKCGQVGYDLVAHHIFSYATHKKLRTDENNGTTFCDSCHRKFHSINGRKTNMKQLETYLDTTITM